MVTLITAVFGPLVEFECRRALGRGWLILVRTLAALAVLSVTMIVLWYGWICVYSDPDYRPYTELRFGLAIVDGVLLTIALVLAPAVLAGSLAGEKERGALGLLLTTTVSAREVVAGRFAGKMTQLIMILLVGTPPIVLLAALTGSSGRVMGVLLLFPLAVGFGGGGLATAVSAVSRRGRDALLSVYLMDLLFLLTPLAGSLGIAFGPFDWLAVLNPYAALGSLIWQERLGEVLLSIGLWVALGLVGVGVACWRLAPSCLGQIDGARLGRAGKRRGRVPPLRDRPMVWKELYIESAGRLGGFGRWVGAFLTLALVAGSVTMAGLVLWDRWQGNAPAWSAWAQTMLKIGVGGSSMIVAWLIEWAIGLRAAVTIASERERGTWDGILTSPLEAREIVRAKIWGSLFALRWLFAAALLAWTLAFAVDAMTFKEYTGAVAGTLVVGAFMAAVGFRASLGSSTATRAMALTIGLWLGAMIAFSILSAILTGIAWLILFFGLSALTNTGLSTATNLRSYQWFMEVLSIAITCLPYAVTTLILISLTSLRFDRMAGRSAGDRFVNLADRANPHAELKPATNSYEETTSVGPDVPPGS